MGFALLLGILGEKVRDLLDAEGKKANESTRRVGGERDAKRKKAREREMASRSDGSYERVLPEGRIFSATRKRSETGGARGRWRTTDREGGSRRKKRVGGDEEAEGGWREEGSLARREGESALPLPRASSLSLSLPFLAFFLGEIDQRPRETD